MNQATTTHTSLVPLPHETISLMHFKRFLAAASAPTAVPFPRDDAQARQSQVNFRVLHVKRTPTVPKLPVLAPAGQRELTPVPL